MQLPITIGLRRSLLVERGLLLGAALASTMIIAFPRSTLAQGAILLVVWGLFVIARMRLQAPFALIRLERDGRVHVASKAAESEFLAAELLPGATVHPWLTVFRLKVPDGQTKTVIATVNSLAAEDFRRLRVYLRWQADFSAPGAAAE